jgi:hypothetical protein
VDPDSTGLNPAWRKSLVLVILSATWRDGANLTEIGAARQLLIQDMKILEGIAPESGAYFNEVSDPCPFTTLRLNSLSHARRLRDPNLTGRNRSSVLTTISSGPSSRNTIRVLCSSSTKASDQTNGTQISFAKSETTQPTGTGLLRSQGGMHSLGVTVHSCIASELS